MSDFVKTLGAVTILSVTSKNVIMPKEIGNSSFFIVKIFKIVNPFVIIFILMAQIVVLNIEHPKF